MHLIPRSGPELLEDLISLNADEWNIRLAKELGISVDYLRNLFVTQDKISLIREKIKLDIQKAKIKELGKKQSDSDNTNILDLERSSSEEETTEILQRPTKLDRFTVRILSTDPIIESISASGKVIIGMDFTDAKLSDSFFSHCTFFNCNFTGADFGESTFQTCVLNSCLFTRADFRNAVISRGLIMDCDFHNCTMDGVTVTDTPIIATPFGYGTFLQAVFMNSGFSECKLPQSIWTDATLVSMSFTNCNLNGSKFRRTRFCDLTLIKVNLMGCDLDNAIVTAITGSLLEYDNKYSELFKMNHMLFSPSIVEWDPDPQEDNEDVESDSPSFDEGGIHPLDEDEEDENPSY